MKELDQCYKILELGLDASPEQIKQAYRDLARVWHPDRFSHDPRLQQKAQEKLKEINDAYERLRSEDSGCYTKGSESKPKYQKTEAEPESSSTRTYQPPTEPSQNASPKQARDWRVLILFVILAGSVLLILLLRQSKRSENTSPLIADNSNSKMADANTPDSTTPPNESKPAPIPEGFEEVDVSKSTDLTVISKLLTSETDLIKLYGRQNVQIKNIEVGEGETEPGTVIFPEESEKAAGFLWENRDRRQRLQSVRISGKKSVWEVGHGITLGTTLRELEHLNGKPFLLAGFGWDYSGTVMSWENGNLEKEFTTNGRVILRCRPIQEIYKMVSSQEAESVLGDKDFRSDDKVMRKINPQVYEIIIEHK